MNKKISKIALLLVLFLPFYFFGQDSQLEPEEPIFEFPDSDDLSEQDFQESDEESFFSDQNQIYKKNITIAHTPSLQTLNPHKSSYSSEAQILINVYEGLFSYNSKNLAPEFAIAKEYKISRDKKRWTFILRDDAKFSDGTKITAEDVKNSWVKLLQTKNAPYSSLFDIVKGAKNVRNGGALEDLGIYVLDENTISIHLNNPASYLPKLLCLPSFSVISQNPGVFSGPFYISMVTPTEIELLKNYEYYDQKNVSLEQVSFLLTDDSEENAYLYNTGLADWVTGNAKLEKIINENAKQISAQFATEFFFFKNYNESSQFKTKDFDIWNKKEFRAALLEACPWDLLRKNVFVKANTLVYPTADYPEVQGYDYTDPIEAKNLMQNARKKYNIPEEQILNLSIAVSEYSVERVKIFEDAWSPLGVNVNFTILKANDYLTKQNSTSADLFLYSWIGDFLDPLAFLELFKSDSILNTSNWKNQEFDEKLQEANLYTDSTRFKLLSEAEQILLDDAEILPIQHTVSLNIINLQEISGWYINEFDLHPLKDVFILEKQKSYPGLVKSLNL